MHCGFMGWPPGHVSRARYLIVVVFFMWFRSCRSALLGLLVLASLSGCGVISLAGSVASVAVDVTGAVVTTGVKATGAVIDVVTDDD